MRRYGSGPKEKILGAEVQVRTIYVRGAEVRYRTTPNLVTRPGTLGLKVILIRWQKRKIFLYEFSSCVQIEGKKTANDFKVITLWMNDTK